jgi:D-alanyl-D-alanine carboxypeptidase
MRNGLVTVLAGAGAVVFATTVLAAEPTQVERVQAALDAWLAARAPIEKVTGIAAYISFGAAGPAIEAFAGKVGRDPDAGPVDQDTLYQMGSTSKSFTVAVILQLEAAGKLSIDDTLSKWLPEYPAWKDVTIRRLLDMTSGIPTYSETEWMSRAWANEPMRAFTVKELADAAYPSATNHLPLSKGYHYSNTNYVLAGMIAEKASGKSFRDLVQELVIEPHGLTSTFYEASTYPEAVIKRLSHGYFENEACADYHPNARNRGTFRSSGETCAKSAPPGCNRPAAPSPAPATSIVGCAPFSAGRWFHRSSNKNGLSLSRPKPASRSRRCLPMTRKASPSGWATGFLGLSAPNGCTRARV